MKNKTVTIRFEGILEVVDAPKSKPRADKILIRKNFTALCGSDIKLYNGTYTAPHKYPVVIGHDWVEEVVETGTGVSQRWNIGDIVTGDCSIYCYKCRKCLRNYRNHCLSVEKKGITVDGGCAQYSVVNQQHLYRSPRLPDLKPLALIDPLSVTVEAVLNRLSDVELKNTRNALIIGSVGIGAMAVFMLAEAGIPEILIVDVSSDKLDIVDSFGLANVKTVQTDLSGNELGASTEYDLIIEAAGSGDAFSRAVELAVPRGKIVCVGHEQGVELDFSLAIKKSLTIHFSIGSTGGFGKSIGIIKKYYTNVRKLITNVVAIDDVEQYFSMNRAKDTDIKNTYRPDLSTHALPTNLLPLYK